MSALRWRTCLTLLNFLVCRYMGQNRNLEVLDMCMVTGITENGLVPICNNLQHLEALNVAWTNMTRGAVLYLVICLTPTLVKLNLSGCRETLLDEGEYVKQTGRHLFWMMWILEPTANSVWYQTLGRGATNVYPLSQSLIICLE